MDVTKLYLNNDGFLSFWECWEDDGKIIVHQGKVGDEGETEEMKSTKSARQKMNSIKLQKIEAGYSPFPEEEMALLLIEYKIADMGTPTDVEKRQNLESTLDNLLGWTGLGHCDGGSTGSGTMEVCSVVVDFEIAKRVIVEELTGTEFENYLRIYREEA